MQKYNYTFYHIRPKNYVLQSQQWIKDRREN